MEKLIFLIRKITILYIFYIPLVELTQVSPPTSTQISLPASTQVSLPTSTQISLPASTQVSLPTSTQVSLPASTQVSLPTSTQVSLPASTQSTNNPDKNMKDYYTIVYVNTGIDFWSPDLLGINNGINKLNEYLTNLESKSDTSSEKKKLITEFKGIFDKIYKEQGKDIDNIEYDAINWMLENKKIKQSRLGNKYVFTDKDNYSCNSENNLMMRYQKKIIDRINEEKKPDIFIMGELCWKNIEHIGGV